MVNIYRRLGATYSIIRTFSPIKLTGAILAFEVSVNNYRNMRPRTTQHLPPSEPRINFAGTKKCLQIKLCSETKCTLINLIIMYAPSYHFCLLLIKYIFLFKLCCNSGTESKNTRFFRKASFQYLLVRSSGTRSHLQTRFTNISNSEKPDATILKK